MQPQNAEIPHSIAVDVKNLAMRLSAAIGTKEHLEAVLAPGANPGELPLLLNRTSEVAANALLRGFGAKWNEQTLAEGSFPALTRDLLFGVHAFLGTIGAIMESKRTLSPNVSKLLIESSYHFLSTKSRAIADFDLNVNRAR